MNKVLGIIGAICFALSVALGYFADFSGDALVEIAIASFGITALIVSAIKNAKSQGKFSWKTVVCIVLASVGGILCCIGGLAQSIFATISGAIIALMSIIFGLLFEKKE